MHCIFLDTSYLRGVSLRDPDFRKLLHASKQGDVRLCISEIAWEEWRTWWVHQTVKKIRKANEAFEALHGGWDQGFLTGSLKPPNIDVVGEEELDRHSRGHVGKLAQEHKIQILRPAPDHGDRVWRRYFACDAPFDGEQEREKRRLDIPDAWIIESAIDLLADNAGLIALCRDGKMSGALEGHGIRVLGQTEDVLNLIESPADQREEPSDETDVPSTALVGLDPSSVAERLCTIRKPADEIEAFVAGLVGYLGEISKEQLEKLVAQRGMPEALGRNAAERLALLGVIRDTGNFYLPHDKELCERAAGDVESFIIDALQD